MFREEAEKAGTQKFSDNVVKNIIAAKRAPGADPVLFYHTIIEFCVLPEGVFIDSMFQKSTGGFYVLGILKAIYED